MGIFIQEKDFRNEKIIKTAFVHRLRALFCPIGKSGHLPSTVITARTELTSRRITVPMRTGQNATTGQQRETSILIRDRRVQEPTTTTADVLRDIRKSAVFRATETVCADQTAFIDNAAKAPEKSGAFHFVQFFFGNGKGDTLTRSGNMSI